MKFNTAIAAMMEFTNDVYKCGYRISTEDVSFVTAFLSKSQFERFVLLLAPMAPHIAEELWQRLGHKETLAYEPWPTFDEKMIAEETLELPVQVNGKMRGRISVPADADEEAIVAAALADEKVAKFTEGKNVIKKIIVPGRLVNLVVE
jgi:leucyl-tRNA synthetase